MSENSIVIVGASTVVVSVLVKIIGLPDQIRKNHKRKSTKGLSAPFFLLGLLSYVLWTFYGLLQNDWVIVLGQGIGVLTMGIIVYQIWFYKDAKS